MFKFFSIVLVFNLFIFLFYIYDKTIISIQTMFLFIEVGLVLIIGFNWFDEYLEKIRYLDIVKYYEEM